MQKCDTKGPKKIEDHSSITGVVSAGQFENFGASTYESQNENNLLTASKTIVINDIVNSWVLYTTLILKDTGFTNILLRCFIIPPVI